MFERAPVRSFLNLNAMKVQRINTIAELQAEQDRLVANMRRTRKEFQHSASATTTGGAQFLMKNILLPAGAIGLGVFMAKRLSNGRGTTDHTPAHVQYEAAIGENGNSGWFSRFMLVALPVVQQLFLKAKADENAALGTTDDDGEQPYGTQANGTATSWLSTLVPVAIPLVQQYFLKISEKANEHPITVDMEDGEVVEGTFAAKKGGPASIFESLYKLLPVVLPLVQQYFAPANLAEDRSAKKKHFGNGQYAPAE